MWYYYNDKNNTMRYILGEKGSNPLFCIGINPSTAEPDNLDPTLKRVKSFSLNNNFNGWVMLNIYPQRSTNPNELDFKFNKNMHRENINYIKKILSCYNSPTIWAAWGILIEKRDFLINCLYEIFEECKNVNAQWIRFGNLTKKGHPRHPLYLRFDSEKFKFEINNYVRDAV